MLVSPFNFHSFLAPVVAGVRFIHRRTKMRSFIVKIAFHHNKISIIKMVRAVGRVDAYDHIGLKEAMDWTKAKIAFNNLEWTERPLLKTITLRVNEAELGRLYHYLFWGPKAGELYDSHIISVEEQNDMIDFDFNQRDFNQREYKL
jgi:hypothetical protein